MAKSSQIAVLLVLLLLSACIPAAAQKQGPVRFRMTLLSLYEKSDLIFIGRFDKKEDSGTNRVGDGFTAVTTKTYFDVSTVLKGEARKFVVLDDEEFRYQIQPKNAGEAPRDAIFVEDIGSYDADAQAKTGDTVIVFATGQGDSFELTDQRDGIKKVSAENGSIYAARVRELNEIFSGNKPDPAKVGEWLIRCAHESVTRWDGAHELLQGVRRLNWQAGTEAMIANSFDPLVAGDLGREATRTLTPEQKTELSQMLLSLEPAAGSTTSGLSLGDRELISLVRNWDTSSVATCLAAQLRSQAFSAHENAGFMYMIAELLGNAKAASLARQYAESSASAAAATEQNETQKKTVGSFLGLIDKLLAADRSKNPC